MTSRFSCRRQSVLSQCFVSQIAELKRGAEIIVCTPGRMIDMLGANSGKCVCDPCVFVLQLLRLPSEDCSGLNTSSACLATHTSLMSAGVPFCFVAVLTDCISAHVTMLQLFAF